MEKYSVVVSDNVEKELKLHYKSGDKPVIKRNDRIFKDLLVHPYKGVGKPEALKYDLAVRWSRRINKKSRLVYKVNEDEFIVTILSVSGHYFDK